MYICIHIVYIHLSIHIYIYIYIICAHTGASICAGFSAGAVVEFTRAQWELPSPWSLLELCSVASCPDLTGTKGVPRKGV